MDRIAKEKNIKYYFTGVTNGSNHDILLELFKTGILDPKNIHISWDGLGSTARKTNNKWNDTYYKKIFNIYGNQLHYPIHTSMAITSYNITKLSSTMKDLISWGITGIGYYLIAQYDYTDPNFLLEFQCQLEDFMDYYSKANKYGNLHFENYRFFKESEECPINHLCPNLGNVVCIDQEGDIYPCPWMLEYKVLKLGNLINNFDIDLVNAFIKEYEKPYTCNYKKCGITHCIFCPGSNYINDGGLECVNTRACQLYNIEKQIFSKYKDIPEELCTDISNPLNNVPDFMRC